MQRWKKIGLGLITVALLLTAGVVGYWLATRQPPSPIPETVRSQLDFSPLIIPSSVKSIRTDSYKFSQAEDSTKVLSYLLYINNVTVSVTEYVQPKQFVDVPEYKDRFLSNVVGQAGSVQTANGVIYIGKTSKQVTKQLGVMLEKGLLIFFSPSSDLEDATWRSIGDSLVVETVTK